MARPRWLHSRGRRTDTLPLAEVLLFIIMLLHRPLPAAAVALL